MSKYLKTFISWMSETKWHIAYMTLIILGAISLTNDVLKGGAIFIISGFVLWATEALYIGYKKNRYRYKKLPPIDVIIRNFNINMLNRDIKLDRKYRIVYKDLEKIFKDTSLTYTDRFLLISYKHEEEYMYVYKDNSIELHGQSIFWERMVKFMKKYNTTNVNSIEYLMIWYINNCLKR